MWITVYPKVQQRLSIPDKCPSFLYSPNPSWFPHSTLCEQHPHPQLIRIPKNSATQSAQGSRAIFKLNPLETFTAAGPSNFINVQPNNNKDTQNANSHLSILFSSQVFLRYFISREEGTGYSLFTSLRSISRVQQINRPGSRGCGYHATGVRHWLIPSSSKCWALTYIGQGYCVRCGIQRWIRKTFIWSI